MSKYQSFKGLASSKSIIGGGRGPKTQNPIGGGMPKKNSPLPAGTLRKMRGNKMGKIGGAF